MSENQVERRQLDRFERDRDAFSLGRASSQKAGGALDEAGNPKPWTAEFNLSLGYDSNPDALHDAKRAMFAELDATFTYDIWRNGKFNSDPMHSYTDQLTVGYEFDGKAFDGAVQDADEIDQVVSISYAHLFSNQLRGTLDVSEEYDHIDDSSFLSKLDVKPAVRYQVADWIGVEGAYVYRHSDFLFQPSSPVRDPDSNRHILLANLLLFPKKDSGPLPLGIFKSLKVGYAHTWNDADGSDYDYDGDEINVDIKGIAPWPDKRFSGRVKYTHRWNDYRHINSLSVGGVRRYDQVDLLDVELDFTPNDDSPWTIYAKYSLNNNRSNIDSKDFVENIFRIGIDFNF